MSILFTAFLFYILKYYTYINAVLFFHFGALKGDSDVRLQLYKCISGGTWQSHPGPDFVRISLKIRSN